MSQYAEGISHVDTDRVRTHYGTSAAVRPRHFLATFAVLLMAGMGMRLWNLGETSLWTDEVMSAYRAESTIQGSLQSIMHVGNQMPFYFFVLRAMPDGSDAMLRLPSAILGVSGIALLVLMVLRLYGSYELALWAGALLTFNPFHVWLSRTARFYTLVFVLAMLISYCFLLLLRGNRSHPVWYAFVGISMAAYMTHYTTLALPAAQLTVIVLARRKEDRQFFWQWGIAQCLAAVPVVVWLGILTQNPPEVGPQWVPVPGLRDIALTLWHLTIGIGCSTTRDWDAVLGRAAVAGALVSGIIYALHNQRHHRENLYWLALVSIPPVVVFTISTLGVSFYVDRYFTVLLPGLILLLTMSIQQLPRRLGQILLTAIVVTGAASIHTTFDRGDHEREDWYNVAAFIANHTSPSDGIVVDRMNVERAFLRYYPVSQSGSPALARLEAIPDTTLFEQSVECIWVVFRNPHEDVHRQGVMPPFDPFEQGHTPLGDWVFDRRDLVVMQREFNGVTVVLLDLGKAKECG